MTACVTFADINYQLESFDVTNLLLAHAGQQVVLMFRGTTANAVGTPQFYTSWAVDDVALDVS